jgi:protease-4
MKQFFGAFFGSIVGMLVATLLAVLLLVAIVKASVNTALKGEEEQTEAVNENSVLRLTLEGRISEREKENPFRQLGGVTPFVDAESMGLNVLLKKIRSAATDDKVKGIFLRLRHVQASGFATIEELRHALADFRAKGKFVYSYSENYTQQSYYLASVSDKVFLNPQGSLTWKGLSMNLLFFKNALEKLGVEMQVFKMGKFKSAIEPIVLDKMSAANRLQSEVFLNSIWQSMLHDIATSRKVSIEELNAMANNLSIRFPEDAKGTLIDEAMYEDEVVDEIKKKVGRKKDEDMEFADFRNYHAKGDGVKAGAGRIAVIYATGAINSGEGGDEEVGSVTLAKAIHEARTDDKIKAIVLRVNSPGGSALASDVIWREMVLAQKAKPTVVSMGDVAASGGYYISCAADRIFAQPNTITGSIGVFGVIPNLGPMLEQKLGITVDTVNTNRSSDIASGLRKVTENEHNFIQASVEKVYDTFKTHVSEGRHIAKDEVDSLGQGRVWSGSDAQRLKLVDEFGGLEDAIVWAAKKADTKNYRIMELPRLKGPFEGFFNNKEKEVEKGVTRSALGRAYPYYIHFKALLDLNGVQARLPFNFEVD